MHRLRLRWVIPFALAAIGMVVIAPSTANAVPNLQNGCKNTLTSGPNPGAEMGHYPAWPASQSYLRIACIFNHSTGGTGDFVSATYTIHDFSNVVYHSGAARTVTLAAGGVGIGATVLPVNDCTSMLTWTNRKINTVGGVPGLQARVQVNSVGGGCAPGGNLTINRPTTAAILGGTVFQVENSSVRDVSDATISPVSPHVCSAFANFNAFDQAPANLISVTGTLLTAPPGTVSTTTGPPAVACPAGQTGVDLTNAPTGAGVNQTITIGGTLDGSAPAATNVTSTRTFNDAFYVIQGAAPCNIAIAANQVCSPVARFFLTDVGLKISGTGIVGAPCYVQTRNSAVLITLSAGCTNDGSAGAHTLTLGEPSRTAPTATDTVINQGVQLPLNPALVPGSPPCTDDDAAGFGIEGTWVNPGSFIGGAFATQPPNTKAVGEVLFQTSVTTFGAYILEMPVASADPLIPAFHYNIVFPNVPTGIALCPSTATSPGLGFSLGVNATTASVALIPTGNGRPGTAQLRSTRANTSGGPVSSTLFLTDDVNGGGVKWVGADFNRLCGPLAAGNPVINFTCGDG